MASYDIGQLVWRITGDSSGINRSLSSAEQRVGKTKTAFSKAAKFIGTALVAIGLKRFTASLINAASDAEETANKFGVVYSKVITGANKAAQNLADNYGLSRTASKQLLSDTGDLLTGFGLAQDEALKLSEAAAQLGTDLASFTNYAGGAEGATQALAAAMLGERERVKMLGIAITETDLKKFAEDQGKAWDEMSRGEKAALTLQMAIKQSKNAIGDFQRSQDSYENVQRRVNAQMSNMREELGAKLLPAMSNLGIAFLEASKDGGIFLKLINYTVGSLGRLINAVATSSRIINTYFSEQGKKTKELSKQVDLWVKKHKEAKQNIKEIAEETNYLNGSWRDLYNNVKKVSNNFDDLNAARKAGFTKEQVKAVLAYEIALKGLEITTRESAKASGIYSNELTKIEKGHEDVLGKLEKDLDIREKGKKGFQKTGDEIDKSTKKTKSFWEELTKANKKLDEITKIQRLSAFNDALQGLSNNIISIISNIGTYYDALAEKRLNQIDEQMQAELEAAGFADETAVESAQAQLDAAIAAGDAEAEAEARKQLKKAQIEEKYAKKRAKAEYEAQLQAWKYQVGIASAQIPLSIMNAIASGAQAPWFLQPGFMIAMGATAGAATAANLAAVVATQPEPPKFATGGIVPGTRSTGDNTLAQVSPKEMILNDQQQANLFNMLNQGGFKGGNVYIYLGSNLIYKEMYQASKLGDLIIHADAVVKR